MAVGEQPFGQFGGVDPVAGDQRDADGAHQSAGHPGVGAARDGGGDGRDPGLVPADAGVDDGGARRLDGLREADDLGEGGAAGDEVEHGEPVDQDEVGPDPLAHPPDDLDGQAHAVLVRAAPAVLAPVGGGGDELVDQVALGAHDLHAVVPGPAGERGAADEVLDGALDLVAGEGVRLVRADRGLDRTGRDQLLVVGVPAEVQDLHRDPAALAVDGRGDRAVAVGLRLGGEHGAARPRPALLVGGDAAGDDEADAAADPGRVELGHPLEAVLRLLESDVHRAHQDAVGQRGEAQVEGAQQVRVGGHPRSPRAASSPHGRTPAPLMQQVA